VPPPPAAVPEEDVEDAESRPKGMAFQQHVLSVVEEVAKALREMHCAPHTQVCLISHSADSGACTLAVTLGLHQQQWIERLIDAAKEAVFSRTSRSLGACLLGYKSVPFQPTAAGFTARVGTVARKRKACRQLYTKGSCNHMHRCWWEHPQSIMSINFVVLVSA